MNKRLMAMAVRELAKELHDVDASRLDCDEIVRDAVEVLMVFGRVLEGQSANRAFGSPGDYGYETSIGKALAAREDADQPADAGQREDAGEAPEKLLVPGISFISGISLRDRFAMAAMQGILASGGIYLGEEYALREGVPAIAWFIADAMLVERGGAE